MIGEEVETARAGARGIVGDRAFALADPVSGKIASAKNPSKWPDLFKFRAIYAGEVPEMGPLPPALACCQGRYYTPVTPSAQQADTTPS